MGTARDCIGRACAGLVCVADLRNGLGDRCNLIAAGCPMFNAIARLATML
jgi:hypothetical protein